MNDYVEKDGFVEASSGLLLLYGAGAVVGPLLASLVIRYFTIDSLFAFTAAVHLIFAAFAAYRMRQRGRAQDEERVLFVDSLRVAQTVGTIDPLSKPAEVDSSMTGMSESELPTGKKDTPSET